MRRLFSFSKLIIALLIFSQSALAGIENRWDWKDQKRTLKVYYNFNEETAMIGEKKMKAVVDEAISEWNKAKAETGWEFTKGSKDDHDFDIQLGTISGKDGKQRQAGGAVGRWGLDKNRFIKKGTIIFDPKPKEGFTWGVNDNAKVNPVRVAMHELSHAMRLSHQGKLGTKSGNIKDPTDAITKGEDSITPSADDKKEAKKSSKEPIKRDAATGGATKTVSLMVSGFPLDLPFSVPVQDARLLIPASTFANDAEVVLSGTDLYSMPNPFNTPAGVDHMVKGVRIDITGLISLDDADDASKFFKIQIPYEDGQRGLIDIADPNYAPSFESSLGLFFFDPVGDIWKYFDPNVMGGGFLLDINKNVIGGKLPAYLLGNFSNPDEMATKTLFISIAAVPVPEPATVVLLSIGLAGLAASRRIVRDRVQNARLKT